LNWLKETFPNLHAGRCESNFGVLTAVRPMIEKYALEKADDAYEQMSGRVRFRAVLTN